MRQPQAAKLRASGGPQQPAAEPHHGGGGRLEDEDDHVIRGNLAGVLMAGLVIFSIVGAVIVVMTGGRR